MGLIQVKALEVEVKSSSAAGDRAWELEETRTKGSIRAE